jgi:hypothetical protein
VVSNPTVPVPVVPVRTEDKEKSVLYILDMRPQCLKKGRSCVKFVRFYRYAAHLVILLFVCFRYAATVRVQKHRQEII